MSDINYCIVVLDISFHHILIAWVYFMCEHNHTKTVKKQNKIFPSFYPSLLSVLSDLSPQSSIFLFVQHLNITSSSLWLDVFLNQLSEDVGESSVRLQTHMAAVWLVPLTVCSTTMGIRGLLHAGLWWMDLLCFSVKPPMCNTLWRTHAESAILWRHSTFFMAGLKLVCTYGNHLYIKGGKQITCMSPMKYYSVRGLNNFSLKRN